MPDGEKGELVFTSLTKEAMPVIRYRTRDLTRLMPGTARSMRRMEKITGRSDDMMIVRGVNVFPTQIEEELLKIDSLSAHYQIVLTREGRLDEMEIMVEARPHAASAEERAEAAGQAPGFGQELHRRHREGHGRHPRRDRALARQGETGVG